MRASVDEDEAERRELLEKKRRVLTLQMSDDAIRQRALGHMRSAAKRFTGQADAFKVTAMDAETFRTLCTRLLRLSLSRVELGALLLEVYGIEVIESGVINSDDFLRRFMLIGNTEREKEKQERRKREEEAVKAHEDKQRTRTQPAEPASSSDDYNFTEADEARAIEKLTTASVKFDRRRLASEASSVEAFEMASLAPLSLREWTKTLFGTHLAKKEACALYLLISGQTSGPLTGLIFLRYFLKLGDDRRTELKAVAQKRREADLAKELHDKYDTVRPLSFAFAQQDVDSASSKLRACAAVFSSDRGPRLTELYTASLRAADLKLLLRRELGASFTDAEVAAVASRFLFTEDASGPRGRVAADSLVNGAALSAFFLRIVSEVQTDQRAAAREKDMARLNAEKERAAQRASKEQGGAADFSFTEDDRRLALEKLSTFAGRYDKYAPSAVDLHVFGGIAMTPQVLRQTLLRIVNLKLTPKELGAVFINFQGADGTVSSTLFLQAFVRAGVEQRDLWAHMRQMKVRAREDKERAALTNGLTRQREAMKADAAVDFGFDERDAESAKDKLTRAALSYNKFSTTAPSLELFETGALSAVALRDALKKVFGVLLTPRELGYVVRTYDSAGEGVVRAKAFLRAFLALAHERRKELRRRSPSPVARTVAGAAGSAGGVAAEEDAIIDMHFDPETLDAVLTKLGKAAQNCDIGGAFNGAKVSAKVLLGDIQRALKVSLSPVEMGALLNRIGYTSSVVDTLVFKALLLREKQAYKVKENHRVAAEKRRLREDEAVRSARQALLEAQKQRAPATCSFDEDDKSSALKKLADASASYSAAASGGSFLDSLSCSFLSPIQLRDLLRHELRVQFTPRELAAVVQEYEFNDTGKVKCTSFLNAFVKAGSDRRSMLRLIQMEKQRKKELFEKTAHERKMKELAAKKTLRLDFSLVTEEIKEAVSKKLAVAAARYDKADPTAVPLDGFYCATLGAVELKEQLKRTFNMAVSTVELCALMQLFDGQDSNEVDAQKFVVHFLKLGTLERDKAKAKAMQLQKSAVEERRKQDASKSAVLLAKPYWGVPSDYNDDDIRSALAKLAESLRLSGLSTIAAEELGRFRSDTLEVYEFVSEVKRVLRLRLTDTEWLALVSHFQGDAGKIPCVSFLSHIRMIIRSQDMAMHEGSKKPSANTAAIVEDPEDHCVDYDYSAEDFNNALGKIQMSCAQFRSSSSIDLKSFTGADMRHAEFKDLCSRVLGMSLKPKELGALAKYFQADSKGRISNAAFTVYLSKVHRAEWEKFRQEKLLRNKEKASAANDSHRRRVESWNKEEARSMAFSADDESSFASKVVEALRKYCKSAATYAEGVASMRATTTSARGFRDLFSRVFQVSFSTKECGVLLGAVDMNGTGLVDGGRFITAFLRLSRMNVSELSCAEVMSALRLEDLTRPLVAAFNTIETSNARRSDFKDDATLVKTIDPLTSLTQSGSASRGQKREPNSTPKRPKMLDPIAADSAVFLMSQSALKEKRWKGKKTSSVELPVPVRRKSVEQATAPPNSRREFVFPALLSSAPVFAFSTLSLDAN